jgi:hypothetical protein
MGIEGEKWGVLTYHGAVWELQSFELNEIAVHFD